MRTALAYACLLALIAGTNLQAVPQAPIGINGDLYSWHVGSLATGRGPAAGYWNPAILGYDPSPLDMHFGFSLEDDTHSQYEDWAFFTRMGKLGFGLIHEEGPVGSGFAEHYKLGYGFGSKGHYTGISYNWSNGSSDTLKQNDHFTLASINHFNPWISLGTRFSVALGEKHGLPTATYEGGLGLRPFTDRLTLTVDAAAYLDEDSFISGSDRYWVGLEAEPLDWISVGGRYNLNTKDMTLQAALQLGSSAFGTITSTPDDDNLDPGDRGFVSLCSKDFNQGFFVKPKRNLYARLDLKGLAGEFGWLMSGQHIQLMDFYRQMDALEEHPRVKGLYIYIHPDFAADPTFRHEMRRRILEYKEKTGGEVIFYAEQMSLMDLYLASAGDRRALIPVGGVELNPLGGENLYLAGALEKAGLKVESFAVGRWKGAVEPMTRSSMSDDVRNNVGRLLNELYVVMQDAIAEGYGMDAAEMDEILANWMLTPDMAQELGLVDTLLYKDEVESWVTGEEEKEKSHGITFEFKLGGDSANGGKIVPLASLLPRDIKRHWEAEPEIAVIYAGGPIVSGKSLGPFMIGDETLVAQFKAARENEKIKAVVFHIDSPGGSAYASDLVWREMGKLAEDKPLIVVQGFIAASGGYYLSMQADTILSSPLTITGSIGVAAAIPFNHGLLQASGLNTDGVVAGKPTTFGGAPVMAPINLDAGGAAIRFPTVGFYSRPLEEKQDTQLRASVRFIYDDFVAKAAGGRGKSWEEIHEVAQGQVWSGPTALDFGLVDAMGSLEDGIELARQKVGLKKDRFALSEIYPRLGLKDLLFILQQAGPGMNFDAARQALMEEKIQTAKDARVLINLSGKPEILFDDLIFDQQ
jgi:protease-4